MNQEIDLLEFDDSEAIDFILKNLPSKFKDQIEAADIQYVLDLIIDYYEDNNLLDDNQGSNSTVSEATIAEDDMFYTINKIVKKEEAVDLNEDQLQAILEGEYQFGLSIGIYSEDDDDDDDDSDEE